MRNKVSVKGRVIGGVCRVQGVSTGIDKELILHHLGLSEITANNGE